MGVAIHYCARAAVFAEPFFSNVPSSDAQQITNETAYGHYLFVTKYLVF
jgi:hypothetical protein